MFREHDTIMYAIENVDVHYLEPRAAHPAVYHILRVAAQRGRLNDVLAEAARYGCEQLVRLCVDMGVDWRNNRYDTSAKQLAFENDWTELVEWLCEYEESEFSFDELFLDEE